MLQRMAMAVAVSSLSMGALAQDKPAPPPGYPGEAWIIERSHRRVRFENDGTGAVEHHVRMRVQSDAGIRELGQLIQPYNAAIETMEFRDVRVVKPDGTSAVVPLTQVMELSSPVAEKFPMYTDERQKHLVIPDLRVGDVLEYTVVWTKHSSLAPGQFWYSRSLIATAVALDETIEIDVPRDRPVQMKKVTAAEVTEREEGPRRIYRIVHRSTDPQQIEKARREAARRSEELAPDIDLSSFRSWDELGAWYRALERDRRAPSPEIRAKAAELTRGLASDLEKAQALYDYVATQFRYVSVSLGEGAVQPHAAALTLANGYGDCKDKHTLLAALLAAVGIEAHAALINASGQLDPTVPSLQFDHVISAIRLGKDYVWVDTTTEVAPFGWLAPTLRGKQALVVAPQGPATLVATPAAEDVPSEARIELDGQVDESGKLVARQKETYRGDAEVPIRMALRLLPRDQWILAVERGMRADPKLDTPQDLMVDGDDPSATRQPFSVRVSYTIPHLVKWSGRVPVMRVPDASRDVPDSAMIPLTHDGRLFLGGPWLMTSVSHVELPAGWTPHLPAPARVKEGFGEYTSSYRFEGRTLVVERTLTTHTVTLPRTETEAYDRFRRAVQADRQSAFVMATGTTTGAENTAAAAGADLVNTRAVVAQAAADYKAGTDAYAARDYAGAVTSLKRATQIAPTHPAAWNDLGRAYLELHQVEDARAAFQRQIEVAPRHQYAHNNLGRALRLGGRLAEAEAAFKTAIAIDANDRWAHANLGSLYVQQKQFQSAVPELEKAAVIDATDAWVQVWLGQSYLALAQEDKALAAFDAAVTLRPEPMFWNNAAWQLADAGQRLDQAQAWAESAVASTAARLRSAVPEKIGLSEWRLSRSLASYWDTLGWIQFRRGDAKAALPYVAAALAIAAESEEVKSHARQVATQVPGATAPGGLAPISLPRPPACGAACSITVYVGLGTTGKVTAATLVKPDDASAPAAKSVVGTVHLFPFPEPTPTQVVLPATITCPVSGACQLVFVVGKQIVIR